MILSQMVKILKNGFLVKLFGKSKIISYNSFYHNMIVQVSSTLNSEEKCQKSHFKGTISMTTDFQKTTPLKFLFWVILFSRYQSGILLTFSRSPNKEYKTKRNINIILLTGNDFSKFLIEIIFSYLPYICLQCNFSKW